MRDRSGEFPSRSLKEPESVNRKLIRAALSQTQEQMDSPNRFQRRERPPEQTNAEEFYYLKQMRARTPMVVMLNTGETVHGVIEWYDKRCLKLSRAGKSNLLIMKTAICYMQKEQSGTPNYAVREVG